QIEDPVLSAAVDAAFAHGRSGQPRGDLARLGAAHPVCDREQRRLDDICVLVTPPLASGIRDPTDATDHCSYLRSVSSTRTTSPCVSRRGRSRRAPFRNVPFVDPRSCTQTPSCRGSKRACRAETYSSCAIAMSF